MKKEKNIDKLIEFVKQEIRKEQIKKTVKYNQKKYEQEALKKINN